MKVPEALPRDIEREDIKALLEVIDHVRDRTMFLMLLRTGMRIGELVDLRIRESFTTTYLFRKAVIVPNILLEINLLKR